MGLYFPPFVELRNSPEFLPLLSRDRTGWPRCLLWHGWLPGLTSRTVGIPWATASSDLASSCLENALGPCTLSTTSVWHPFWDQDDVQDMIDDVPVAPNIWTDGSRERIPHLDVEIAGAVPSFILQLSSLMIIIGVMLKILMIVMKAAPTSSQVSLAHFSLSKELSVGGLFLLCKLILVFILVLTI